MRQPPTGVEAGESAGIKMNLINPRVTTLAPQVGQTEPLTSRPGGARGGGSTRDERRGRPR